MLHATFFITNPRERWVISRQPAINPAFAIAEVLWIIAGRNDSRFINYWNPDLPRFAGTGSTYHGAYGYRLRRQFGFDQIQSAFTALEANPDSRQVVLQIWDPRSDFPASDGSPAAEDIPCNVCSLLKVRAGRLEWMQVMRSNDMLLGTPYNFVQFTTLQEVMAGWLRVEVGEYAHFSDSLHVYEHDVGKFSVAANAPTLPNPDRLSLPKIESDAVFKRMTAVAEFLTNPRLTRSQFIDTCADCDLPEAYNNLLAIMAADAARRRKWHAEMDRAASRCSNRLLQFLWEQWRERTQQRELKGGAEA